MVDALFYFLPENEKRAEQKNLTLGEADVDGIAILEN